MSNVKENPPEATVNPSKAANEIGKGALAAFLIFFLGAIASAFGGYCGACCHHISNGIKQEPERPRTVV